MREAVKPIMTRCVTCKKLERKAFSIPRTASLYIGQVSDYPSFTNTGVDFAGPLFDTDQVEKKGD